MYEYLPKIVCGTVQNNIHILNFSQISTADMDIIGLAPVPLI